jgi:putative hydrolase
MFIEMEQSLVEADTHTHTIASSHAYSTVLELAQYAAAAGLKAIAVTDHGPALPDGVASPWHYSNLRCLPPYICGVRVLHGAEANIIDFDGSLDIMLKHQQELDWIIASLHEPSFAPGSVEEHTRAYLAVARNQYIDVIGHSGSEAFKYDYEKVLPVFKAKSKLVEINSHSFEARVGAAENCRNIALICKKYDIPIVVNSDAHSCFSVGNVKEAFRMLSAIDFPTGLIINLEFSRLALWIENKRNRKII